MTSKRKPRDKTIPLPPDQIQRAMNIHGPARSLREMQSDETVQRGSDDSATSEGASSHEWSHVKKPKAAPPVTIQSTIWQRNGEVITIIGSAIAIVLVGISILIQVSEVKSIVTNVREDNVKHEAAISALKDYLEEMRRENEKQLERIETKIDIHAQSQAATQMTKAERR